MILAKSCFAKDNIFERGTVRLGSLHEYRETEQEQIADKDEGKYEFSIFFFEGTVLKRTWVNALFYPLMRLSMPGEKVAPRAHIEGPCSAAVHSFLWKAWSSDGEDITIKSAATTIRREAVNGLIFCMSLVDHESEAKGIFPDYDDCWYLPIAMVDDFAQKLTKALIKRIVEGRINGNHLIPEHYDIEKLNVNCEYGLVHYIPRNIFIKSQAQIKAEEIIYLTENMHFVKPPCFEREKEFRFSFRISIDGKTVLPLSNSAILDASEFKSWCYKHV